MKILVCICGWKSEYYPDNTIFAGLGGELSCPECTRLKRNRGLEVYGHVHIEDEKGYRLCSCGQWFIPNPSSRSELCGNCNKNLQELIEKYKKEQKERW